MVVFTIANDRLIAQQSNYVWALDSVHDQTADCRTLKPLDIADDHRRHDLANEVKRSMTGEHIVNVLGRLIKIYASRKFIG